MPYRKNDNNNGRIKDFRDGQPVYKSSAGKRGGEGAKSAGGRSGGRGYAKPDTNARGGEEAQLQGGYSKKSYSGSRSETEARSEYKRNDKPRYGENKPAGDENRRGGFKRGAAPRNYGAKSAESADYPFKTAEQQDEERRERSTGFEKRGRYGDRDKRGFERRAPRPADEGSKEAVQAPLREDELPYILMGRNAVKEAVKSGRSIDRILVQNDPDGSLREIISLARDKQIQIREVDRSKLDEMCLPFGHGNKTGNHQGIVAQVPGVQYCEISDILAVAKERGEKPFVVILDGIEDPYNLGSILRSAECAGAHGVIIPKRRAAGVTSSACKASAGAVEYIKVAQVSNLSGAIERLKDAGLWIAGADMAGESMTKADFKGAIGLVIGSEGKGISELVKKNCDFLVSIPMKGKIDSLNASVAAAILLYEKMRSEQS